MLDEVSGSDIRNVVLGIIAGLLTLAVIWFVRVPLLRLVGRPVRLMVRQAPPALYRLIIRGADKVNFPNIESDRRAELTARIEHLRQSKTKRFALVGSIYADINIRPVTGASLKPGEFDDANITANIGGSAWYVGHYLYRYGVKSYLFTRLGHRDSPFTRVIMKHLRNEDWIKGGANFTRGEPESGVSVHLEQADETFRTTFTQRGALKGLGWDRLVNRLEKKLGRTGVLYISGYFRTSLCDNLCDSLERLSAGAIVCVDHGRFQVGDQGVAVRALMDAFKAGLVDCYLCTADEMRDLASGVGLGATGGTSLEEIADRLSQDQHLPRVTAILDAGGADIRVHVVVDGKFISLKEVRNAHWRAHRPGPRNAFNAGFLHELAYGNPALDLEEMACEAAREGLHRLVVSNTK
jgi:sugar/nucleoside kinase (ribokinase family)